MPRTRKSRCNRKHKAPNHGKRPVNHVRRRSRRLV